ncbi:hypothetical protein [Shewanella baltica]|uniref:hypothetical protein n=1 Tax=Shewanella baltica TaxID=62322 RepID=UPI00217CF708|nr:hypothetical protein [Shewanella baltica]MCS6096197.1 hypothetical protein [Shewanella baltica]MCS6227305.1 hypothetical protein [Shewanella baltica]
MKEAFVDHLFSKIVEGRFEKVLSSAAVKAKLKLLDNVSNTIQSNYGEEVAQNVLGYQEVRRSLEQCLDFIENQFSTVTKTDFSIYLYYAQIRLREAEEIIDSELSELNL